MDQDPLDLAIPDDGEFFCEIRKHQGFSGDVNHEAEREWLRRLAAASASRRAQFDQILSHQGYLDALTAFLRAGLCGLFAGFRFQAMCEVMTSGTEEESLYRLTDTLHFWKHVFGGDVDLMSRLSRADVAALQGKAPGAADTDKQSLLLLIETGQIFHSYSLHERQSISKAICAQTSDCTVPSMATFFTDWALLRVAAALLKQLLPSVGEVSHLIRDSICRGDQAADRCVVQLTESEYTFVCCGGTAGVEVGRRQLWLAALRRARATMDTTPTATQQMRDSAAGLQGLADLAKALGVVLRGSTLKRRVAKPLEPDDIRRSSNHRRTYRRRQRESMFVIDMHTLRQHVVSGIAADFVWRSVYFTFFGRHLPFNISVIPAFPAVYDLEEAVARVECDADAELGSLRRVQAKQSTPRRGRELPVIEQELSHRAGLFDAVKRTEHAHKAKGLSERRTEEWTEMVSTQMSDMHRQHPRPVQDDHGESVATRHHTAGESPSPPHMPETEEPSALAASTSQLSPSIQDNRYSQPPQLPEKFHDASVSPTSRSQGPNRTAMQPRVVETPVAAQTARRRASTRQLSTAHRRPTRHGWKIWSR